MTLSDRFQCWHCELWQGESDAPLGPSRLCASCKHAMGGGDTVPIPAFTADEAAAEYFASNGGMDYRGDDK